MDSSAMLFISLAFLFAVVWFVTSADRHDQRRLDINEEKRYQRKVDEAREFGYKNSKLKNENNQSSNN